MKSLFNKYIWLQLILSILLLFGGALIVVFVATGKEAVIRDGLNIVVAVILFLFGLFAIVASLAFEPDKIFTGALFYGSASIALGVFLCAKEVVLLVYIAYLLAVFFIVVGVVQLTKAIILVIKKSDKSFAIIAAFIMAVIFIAGGILALVFKDKVQLVFCVVVGVILFAIGVYLLVTGVMTMIGQTKLNKKPRANKSKKRGHKKEEKDEEPVPEEEPQEIKELDYTEEKKEPEALPLNEEVVDPQE